MGGAQIGTVTGVENVIRSFSSSDLTVISDKAIPKSFNDNLTEARALVYASTPVLVVPDQTIIQNNASSPIMNSSSTILAIDPTTYSWVMSVTFSDDTPSNVFQRLEDNNTILLTSPLAKSLNVSVGNEVEIRYLDHENRTEAQTIQISTPYGTQERTVYYNYTVPVLAWKNFTVVGVAQGAWLDVMSFGNFVLSEASYISYNNLNATFPTSFSDYNDTANVFFVKLQPNSNIDQARTTIQNSYGKEYKLSISTYEDAVQRVRSSIDQIFYILYSVVVFAVVNAGIGVSAIMIMNVAERRREIGIYRSQGMSRSQLVTSIVGEAAFLGVVGSIMGVVVGLMFHRVTVSYMRVEGFPMAFIIPFAAIEITIFLALLTAVIGSVYPAYRASKQNIVDSIRQ
jgi:ABC-type lipoprotein release transport system permease subunit